VEGAFFWSQNNYLRLFSQLLFLEVSKPFLEPGTGRAPGLNVPPSNGSIGQADF